MKRLVNLAESALADGPPNWYYAAVAAAAVTMLAAKFATLC